MKKAKNRTFGSGLRDLSIGKDRKYLVVRVGGRRTKLISTVVHPETKNKKTVLLENDGGPRLRMRVSSSGFYTSNKNKVSDTVKPPVRPPTRRVASSIGKHKK